MKYIKNVLISIDQFFNALTGGDPDETISSRVGKLVRSWNTPRKWTIAHWLNVILDKIEKDHCKKSIEEDEGKDSIL